MKEKARSIGSIMFSQVGFFWLVLVIFMAVSVTESGDFFNKAITHDVFYGTLGYAVATVFDLLSLVCMIARMNASRIADRKGEWLSLLGVIVCAGVSAFANVSSAKQAYDPAQFSQVPLWMQNVAPYLGMVFPGMIVIVTLIADHIGDLNPQRQDSVTKYREKEEKKVALLRVRYDIERQMAAVKKDMAELRQRPARKVTQMRQEHDRVVASLRQEHAHIVADLQARYDRDIRALNERITLLQATTPTTQNMTRDTTATMPQEQATEPLRVVKLRAKKATRQATSPDDFAAQIVAYQQRHPDANLSRVAQHFGVSVRTIQRRLSVTA